jgi:mycothiol synthase
VPVPASDAVPVAVTPLADTDVRLATVLLDDRDRATGVPPVDEAERVRLERRLGAGERAPGWLPVIARRDGTAVGYGAVVVGDPGDPATGDAAVAQDVPSDDRGAVLAALFATLVELASTHRAGTLEVWVRDVQDGDLGGAGAAGLVEARRLAILGRDLPVTGPVPPAAAGVTIRASTAADAPAVAAALAAAYAGTPEAGWDEAQLRGRWQLDWFDHDDLLLAVDDATGTVLGLHWLKRRSATVGEVYNLAVAPDGRGRGLGGVLLRAGLDHLAATGCHEVLLWVDRANERAVRLYTGQGFTTRWEDVALRHTPSGTGAT